MGARLSGPHHALIFSSVATVAGTKVDRPGYNCIVVPRDKIVTHESAHFKRITPPRVAALLGGGQLVAHALEVDDVFLQVAEHERCRSLAIVTRPQGVFHNNNRATQKE